MAKINLMVVDISHHNTVTSFDKLYKSGIRGVIHKSSQGVGMIDKFYALRRKAALDAGLLWGAYHFADSSDPMAQAKHFMDVASPDANTLMALDYEPNNNTTMNLKGAQAFLTQLDGDLARKNVIYSGNLIKETLKIKDASGWWSSHPLWLAQYGKSMVLPSQWDQAFLWQFSDGQVNLQGTTVDGLTGQVDRNSFNGTFADLKKQWVIPNAPPVPVAPPVAAVPAQTEAASANTPAAPSFWGKFFG